MSDYLSIVSLHKSFGGLKAVNDLSFKVKRNTTFGIIGPNGAGKTTVFNVISGFMNPDHGQIMWQGCDISGKKPHQIVNMGLSRTFQLVKPFLELSLFDNIRVGCYCPRFMKRVGNMRQIKTKIHELSERIGLPNDLEQSASNLGQGDLRLLDIARALITVPDLLLLDEPFSGLSTMETRRLAGVIQGLNEEGLTILIIEHKLKELMKLVDFIVAIDFGTKLAGGTAQEIVKDAKVIEAYLGSKGKHVIA